MNTLARTQYHKHHRSNGIPPHPYAQILAHRVCVLQHVCRCAFVYVSTVGKRCSEHNVRVYSVCCALCVCVSVSEHTAGAQYNIN